MGNRLLVELLTIYDASPGADEVGRTSVFHQADSCRSTDGC